MKKQKSDNNDDMFSTFLIKERELKYFEERHAKASIMQMSKDFEKREKNATFITKIKDFFQDCIDSHSLNKMKKEAERKMAHIPDEEKCNKELDHKGYKHGDFKTHIFFEKKYTEKTIIADCGGIHFPVIEYNVYIRVEFSPSEIWTNKYLMKDFDSYEEANNYFNILKQEYKNVSAKNILNDLTKKIDNHCDELKSRIKDFGFEL